MSESAPNCPKCGGEMAEGFIPELNLGYLVPFWVVGKPETDCLGSLKVAGKDQYQIETFRCAKCGYLESFATKRRY